MEFPAGKRQKPFDIGGRDRISHLPDSILCHILSFLPTKSSAQTCLLSRRWKFLWSSVPVLDLSDESFLYLHNRRRKESAWASSFRKFANKALSLRSHPSVQILRLKISNPDAVSHAASVISAAIPRNVQEIHLSVLEGTIRLPRILFSCASLSVLKLQCSAVELNTGESVQMPNLKVFHIHYTLSSEFADSVTRLLCGSPILEELVIYNNYRVPESQNISIVSSSLKTLEFCFTGTYANISNLVVIDAPKLEFLDMKARGFKIDFKNTPSILKASIIPREYCYCGGIQEIPSNLWTIVNARVLFLPMCMIKDPSVYELIHFPNLKKLVLRYCGHDGLSILPQILKRLPCLEHLVLHKYNCAQIANTGQGLELEKSEEIHCLKYSLKTLKLENFRCHQSEMEVLEYFVQNSSVLNEIRLCRYFGSEKQPEMLFLNKLLTFPRCSNSFRIIFSD